MLPLPMDFMEGPQERQLGTSAVVKSQTRKWKKMPMGVMIILNDYFIFCDKPTIVSSIDIYTYPEELTANYPRAKCSRQTHLQTRAG